MIPRHEAISDSQFNFHTKFWLWAKPQQLQLIHSGSFGLFVLNLVLFLKERSKSSGPGCIWAHVSVSNLLIFLGHVNKEELLLTNGTVKLQKNYKYIS